MLAGPGWEDRLKELLGSISHSERACLFAVRLADEQGLPIPADTLLDRARTDWFPEFLSHGEMAPHFQPIIDLATGKAYGREALMRGTLGKVELRGAELIAAAEAHDALFSFDTRARAAALEVGLPLLPEGEVLFVNIDPARGDRRRVLDAHHVADRDPPRRRPRPHRPRADPPRALARPRHAQDARRRPPRARRARRARRPLRRRRLARLPRGAAARHRQDRPRDDRGHRALARAPAPRRRARRGRPRAGLPCRRRGHRARRRVRGDARARRRPRPGLLLRTADRQADGGRPAPRAQARASSYRPR